tara:strand:- start:328 stop:552 length:225 start_codon:yes stop_codon:yes gene_type:complete
MFQIHFNDRSLTDFRTAFRTEEENAISKQVHRGLLDRGFILSPRCSGFLSTANTEQEIDDLEIALTETLQETAV